jgi:hypothetical protein
MAAIAAMACFHTGQWRSRRPNCARPASAYPPALPCVAAHKGLRDRVRQGTPKRIGRKQEGHLPNTASRSRLIMPQQPMAIKHAAGPRGTTREVPIEGRRRPGHTSPRLMGDG